MTNGEIGPVEGAEISSLKTNLEGQVEPGSGRQLRAAGRLNLAGGRTTSSMPVVAFDGVMAEARLWAEWADLAELKAYALACFEAMPAAEREAFLAYIQREARP